jgi:uracil-DNA glycosylase family 4
MTDWFDPFSCPICESKECVPISGPTNSKILLLGEAPGRDEINKGRAFVGGIGELLRKEFAYLHFDMRSCKVGNLWAHPSNKNKDCFQYSLQEVLKVAKDMEAILLVGADTVKFFTDQKVTDVNGLKVNSEMLSAPIIYAMYSPAIAFHSVVGEIRLALRKFVSATEHIK